MWPRAPSFLWQCLWSSDHQMNLNKCMAYPIRCDHLGLQDLLSAFAGLLGSLPCNYLGLPLSTRNRRRIERQPLLDRIARRLKPWKVKFMPGKECLTLINSVLTVLTSQNLFLHCISTLQVDYQNDRQDQEKFSLVWIRGA